MTTLTLTAFQFMPNCFILSFKKNFMCPGVLFAYMSVHHMHTVPSETRKGYQIPRNWSYRWLLPPCGCWKLSPGPLFYCWAIFPAPKPNYYFILFRVAHKPIPHTLCVYTPPYSSSPHPSLISMCLIAYVLTFHISSADPQMRTPWKQHLGFGLLF